MEGAKDLFSYETMGTGTGPVPERARAMDVNGHGKTNGSEAEELLEGPAVAE